MHLDDFFFLLRKSFWKREKTFKDPRKNKRNVQEHWEENL